MVLLDVLVKLVRSKKKRIIGFVVSEIICLSEVASSNNKWPGKGSCGSNTKINFVIVNCD